MAQTMEEEPEADWERHYEPEVGKGEPEEREGQGHAEVVLELAMVTLSLLKQDVKVMLHQVKHLVKVNPQLAGEIFTADVDGWTPIHACALRGKRKVLKVMLHAGIDVNVRMGQPEGLPAECTLLHIAANRQDRKVLDYLVSHGADVNARDSFGRTALFYATRMGNREAVKLLTDNGARPFQPVVEVRVTSSTTPVGTSLSDELMTPEPKLNRFCFLALPQHNYHRHHHHQTRHERRQQQQQQQRYHHNGSRYNGHRTS